MSSQQTIDFERRLSTFLADSGLSAFDALVAAGVSLARVIYGLERLHGADAANDIHFRAQDTGRKLV